MSDIEKTIKLSDKDKKYWTNRIDNETNDKRIELNRIIESKIDKQINSKFKSFVSTLNLKSKLEAIKKADAEYTKFLEEKESKERQLEKKLEALCELVVDSFNRHAKINNWALMTSSDDSFNAIDRHLKNTCRDALCVEIKKTSKEGQLLEVMDDQKQKMLDAIHHPKLLFKQVEFEKAIQHGFLNMGIVYNHLQIANTAGSNDSN
jgi:hypothetical protein